MNSLTKEEKRDYYRPFRSIGGFILGITFISNILLSLMTGIFMITSELFKDSIISYNITEFFVYGAIIYSHYIGYRIFIKKYTKNFIELYHVKKNKILNCFFTSIFIFVLIRIVWILWSLLLEKVGYIPNVEDNEFYLIGLIYVVIGAPLIEEIVFRGWILKTLKKYGIVTSVFLSSLTFGIYHGTVIQFVPAFIIGILLSYLVFKYKSIIPGIILHIANNFLSVLNLQFNNSSVLNIIIISLIIISLLVLIFLFFKNIKTIIKSFKEISISFNLMFHSISYILFLIMYLALIIMDFIGVKIT